MGRLVPRALDPNLERWDREAFALFCREKFASTTVREAAASLGIAPSAYMAYRQGDRVPTIANYCNICAGAGQSFGWCLRAC